MQREKQYYRKMLLSDNMGNAHFQKKIMVSGIWYSFCEVGLVFEKEC